MADFSDLKPGDKVLRLLCDRAMMMVVREVLPTVVVCDACLGEGVFSGGWEFDRKTGIEEDEELGWGVKYGRSGSRLVRSGGDS
jgi:hypothetical protein